MIFLRDLATRHHACDRTQRAAFRFRTGAGSSIAAAMGITVGIAMVTALQVGGSLRRVALIGVCGTICSRCRRRLGSD